MTTEINAIDRTAGNIAFPAFSFIRQGIQTRMLIAETDQRFYISRSTIPNAGNGVYAAIDLPAGAMLEVIGVHIEPGSITDACTAWADEYKIRFHDILIIPTGFAGMINHSSEPNLRKVTENDRFYFLMDNAIPAGTELFFAYSHYAVNRFMNRESLINPS